MDSVCSSFRMERATNPFLTLNTPSNMRQEEAFDRFAERADHTGALLLYERLAERGVEVRILPSAH